MSIQTSVSSLTAYLNNKRIRKNQKAIILLSSAAALVASGDTGSAPIIVNEVVQSSTPTVGDDIIVIGSNGSVAATNTGAGNDTITGSDASDTINSGAGNDVINAGKGNDIINGGAGDDIIEGGQGADLIRGGAGKDIIMGGAGVDNIVVIGKSVNGTYTLSDLTNPNGTGIDLSGLISLDDVNNNAQSDATAGEIIDGGADGAVLFIYGEVDLTNVTLKNITSIDVHSTLTISAEQINLLMTLGLDGITGDGNGTTNLIIENYDVSGNGGQNIIINLSGFNLDRIGELTIGTGVTIIADQADIATIKAIKGMGTLQASSSTHQLDFTGKTIDTNLTIHDSAGHDVGYTPHFGSVNAIDLNENLNIAGSFVATNVTGQTITYSHSGADATLFNVNASTGEITFKSATGADFEDAKDANKDNAYQITITATATATVTTGGLTPDTISTDHHVTINLLNLNDTAPEFAAPASTASVNENTTTIPTVAATDADNSPTVLNPLVYSLGTAGDSSFFKVNAITGEVEFKIAPDFETPLDDGANNVYVVTLKVSDTVATAQHTITVTVLDVNESVNQAPVFNVNIPTTVNLNENITAISTYTATDPNGDTLLYTLGGVDKALFAISATGQLTFKTAPDFETPADVNGDNSYLVNVIASDATESAELNLTINVQDVVEIPGAIGTPGDDNPLNGTSGNDTILGLAGNDKIFGLAGDDILNGGVGRDVLNGGDGIDFASYQDATVGVRVHTGWLSQNTGEAAGDSYISIEGLIGSAFNDELIIVNSNGILYGGAGNDKLTAVGGNSTIYGEDGNDGLYANNGTDTLYGGAGNDNLFGYGGNDKLEGGSGNDWLVGGTGNDTFVFKANSGMDGIADFTVHNGSANGDIIELHGLLATNSDFIKLMANATESYGMSTINLDNGDTIELHNVSLNQLSEADFIFIA